jgi:protein-tyrosine phosphatase
MTSTYKDVNINAINNTNLDITDEPITDEPITDEPITDEPITDEPSTDEPTNYKSIRDNEGNVIREIIHTIDDIYCYGRTHIENNFFNICDNNDFSIVIPNLYIGNYSTSTNLELLKQLGITHIISVIPTFNPPFPQDFEYTHISAYDDDWQDIKLFFNDITQKIGNCLIAGEKIYLHCMVGRSRSIAIFLAFLINIVKGNFNHYNIDYNKNTTTSSNLLEYMKLCKNNGSSNIDGVSKKNTSDKITSMDSQDKPQLSPKEQAFIQYKKEQMLNNIDYLIHKYNELKNNSKHTDIIDDMIIYVQKYRPIALPNKNFIEQLKEYILQ